MKTSILFSIVLCAVMLAGTAFLTLQISDIVKRLEKIEADHSADTKRMSDEISTAYTSLGQLEKEVGSLADRVDGLAARKPNDDLEEAIEQKLAERDTRRRERREEQTKQWWARQRERQVNEILEGLEADDKTKEQIVKVVRDLQEAVTVFFTKMGEEGNWDREKTRKALEKMNSEANEAAKKILSEEQYKKFVEIRKKQDERWTRGRR